jgi:hypothetical protein
MLTGSAGENNGFLKSYQSIIMQYSVSQDYLTFHAEWVKFIL